MNLDIFSTNGCVYLVRDKTTPAYWAMFNSTSRDASATALTDAPVIITSVTSQGSDVIGKLVCFNNRRVANVVAKNFGSIEIVGKALLGAVTNTAKFESQLKAFITSSRSSSSGATMGISSKGGGVNTFLLSDYNIGGVDPEYNILDFRLRGVLVD